MRKQFFPALYQHGRGLVFTVAVLSAVSVTNVVDAQVVFEATTDNTTAITNALGPLPSIAGATPDLIVTFGSDTALHASGFVSTDDISTLKGSPLLATDTVTMSLTVDSITGAILRTNGIEFGVASDATFRPAEGNLILGQAGSNSGSDVRIVLTSFQDVGTLDFNSNREALEDGFTITMTANSAGYSFFLEDISVRVSTNPLFVDNDTTALITGTFAGNEFLDFFSTGHFYVATQQFGGTMAVDYSSATMSVGDPPAPTDTLGDFNGDGNVDCADLDGYVGNIGTVAVGALAALDFDGNGTLEPSDANSVITTLIETSNGLVGTFPGDVNCDGQVNVLGDAFALVANLNGPATSYSQGDINFDGQVSVLGDAFALVGNLGMSNE